jgi:four helix bundle protein
MTPEELKKRFKEWAVEVVVFSRSLPTGREYQAIGNQIVRSAPSAAANYRAACRRKSGKDFVNKLKIVEEELDETMFRLEFVVSLSPDLRPSIVPLYKEADELISIIVASINTLRKNIQTHKP